MCNAKTPDERRWLKAMEQLGPEIVHTKLLNAYLQGGSTTETEAEVFGIGSEKPFPSRGFIESWLTKKRRAANCRDAIRFWLIFIPAVVAAIAAVIAVVPTHYNNNQTPQQVRGDKGK